MGNKIRGCYAAPEAEDVQINVTDEGKVFLTLADLGEFDIPLDGESCSLGAESLSVSIGGISFELKAENDGNVLRGTFSENGIACAASLQRYSDRAENYGRYISIRAFENVTPKRCSFTASSLVGHWESDNLSLDIFGEDQGLRFMVRFGESCSFRVPWVNIEDDVILWMMNDSANRGRCVLKYDSGMLCGTYVQLGYGEYPPVCFRKTSDIPTEFGVEYPEGKSRREILIANAEYIRGEECVKTEFMLGEILPPEIKKRGLYGYTDGKSGDEIAFAALDFVCDNWHHDGSASTPKQRTVFDLIKSASVQNNCLNCRGLSLILSAVLRSFGMKAEHVTCMPYEEPFDDCHVVVDCVLPSGKRVMLDPTYRLYFTSGRDYVSLSELRDILIADGTLVPCDRAEYNGAEKGDFDLAFYRNYMTKNTIRFSRGLVNRDGADETICCALYPADYPTEKLSYTGDVAMRDDEKYWEV